MEKEGSMKNFSEKFLKALFVSDIWYTHYFQMQLTSRVQVYHYSSLIKVKVSGQHHVN